MAVTDGDVVRVSVNISLPDLVIAQNIFYWQLDDPDSDNPGNAAVTSNLGTKLTSMYGEIEPNLPDSVTILDAAVDRVEWETDHWEVKENVGVDTLAIVGDDAVNDMAPHGCAGVITAHTSRPQTRGRKFFAGLLEGQFVDSDIGGTLLTALTDLGIEWLIPEALAVTAELIPVILGQSGVSAGLIYPILGLTVNSIIGYQRRRKPGVGS